MVQRHAARADDGPGGGRQERGGRFEEEEGLRRAPGGEFGDVLARFRFRG